MDDIERWLRDVEERHRATTNVPGAFTATEGASRLWYDDLPALVAAVRRLTGILHAKEMHPDYEYATTTGPRKYWDGADRPPDGKGWERNVHRGRVGFPDAGWERFDYHEEAYWMRRRAEGE